jgi:bifunctional DNA-binding transcriptional regulator/antitoxin component of YhaV-PrlF toxin-antitoxin module
MLGMKGEIMQTNARKSGTKKRIAVSGKRQITIPIEFFSELGIGDEVECYMKDGAIVIRPAPVETDGAFAEEILSELIAKGYEGSKLMAEFRKMNRAIRPAARRLMDHADAAARGEAESLGMEDVFGGDSGDV